jgi:uncharacterized protein
MLICVILFALNIPLQYNQTFASEVRVGGSRPSYIYNSANILSHEYTLLIDRYLRDLDKSTSIEIIIYTIPSFIGHNIKKDGHEIQERDLLAYYIFNEVPLDDIKGIGNKDKNNGILVLYSA